MNEQMATDAQQVIDAHMQKIAHRVMDVFERADEDTTADEIMADVFTAIGLSQAFGVTTDRENRSTKP